MELRTNDLPFFISQYNEDMEVCQVWDTFYSQINLSLHLCHQISLDLSHYLLNVIKFKQILFIYLGAQFFSDGLKHIQFFGNRKYHTRVFNII